MEEVKKKAVIEPVRFLDAEKKPTIKQQEKESELKLSCKYGDINIKLSKIPFIKDLL